MAGLDWVIVKHSWSLKPIGAVGFVGDSLAVIAAFYDDKDANQDGKVSFAERIFSFGPMSGKAIAEVASHAYAVPDILMRDTSLAALRGQLLTKFAAGLIAEGIYRTYFSLHIGRAAGAIAGVVTPSAVKSFVIRKGMEQAVKAAYRTGMGY